MSTSMASLSMRKVASPRSLAGAFVSPKVNSLSAILHHTQEPWSPHSVSTLEKSPSLSPYLTPHSKLRSPLQSTTRDLSNKSKSVRKLPWSDGGRKASSGIRSIADSVVTTCHFEECVESVGDLPSADTPNRAEMLNRFQKEIRTLHILGKGSFGTVVEALYKGKNVAVKIIQPSPPACKQATNEMNCLNFHSRHIVSILKVVLPQNDNSGIVIMEKVTGYSLQKLLDHDILKERRSQRLRYSMQLSTALAYCHEHRIMHLDVKPQNVIVDIFSDECKLCDFGCSLQFGAERQNFQGSVGYAAPELLCGNEPTPAADVYSLGVTMWQLISGETPYKGQREHTIIYKVVSAGYRPEMPEISCQEDERYLSLVEKCWSQHPQFRPSVQQVVKELSEAVRDSKS